LKIVGYHSKIAAQQSIYQQLKYIHPPVDVIKND